MVELFSRLAVDAADPDHPAHAYFLERSRLLHDNLAALADAPGAQTRLDPATLAGAVQALADGLQLQWLLDPSVDMAGIMDAVLAALTDLDSPTMAHAPTEPAPETETP